MEEGLLRDVLGIQFADQAPQDHTHGLVVAVEQDFELGAVAAPHRRDELAVRSLSHSVLLLRFEAEVLLDSVRARPYSAGHVPTAVGGR